MELIGSKDIKKTNAVTGKQVNTANTSVFALMYAIKTLAKETVATEQTIAMAA